MRDRRLVEGRHVLIPPMKLWGCSAPFSSSFSSSSFSNNILVFSRLSSPLVSFIVLAVSLLVVSSGKPLLIEISLLAVAFVSSPSNDSAKLLSSTFFMGDPKLGTVAGPACSSACSCTLLQMTWRHSKLRRHRFGQHDSRLRRHGDMAGTGDMATWQVRTT